MQCEIITPGGEKTSVRHWFSVITFSCNRFRHEIVVSTIELEMKYAVLFCTVVRGLYEDIMIKMEKHKHQAEYIYIQNSQLDDFISKL